MELDDDESQDVMVEVLILTQCKHPNIVELYDAFTMGNRITVATHYLFAFNIFSLLLLFITVLEMHFPFLKMF